MPTQSSFDYALIRLVPHVERQEFINVGVILFCRTKHFLGAKIALNQQRLAVIAPQFDIAQIQTHLDLITTISHGGPGPIGQLSQAERFHWLITPRSTVIQTSPVHTGLCVDPAKALEHLIDTMVKVQ